MKKEEYSWVRSKFKLSWIRFFFSFLIFFSIFLKKKNRQTPTLHCPLPQLKAMAGLTGRFPFKPLLSQSSASATATTSAAATTSSASATPFRTSIPPLPLSSSKSNAFKFHLHKSNSLRLVFSFPVSSPIRTSVFARYGGAPRSSGPADSKRSDDEFGLDVSAIRFVLYTCKSSVYDKWILSLTRSSYLFDCFLWLICIGRIMWGLSMHNRTW